MAELNKPKELCEHDHCPNHHNRTDERKIKKIQKFIDKQAKKYLDSIKEQKKKEEESKKIKEAKLRAIDIKSKQMVERSKKLDINESRTTFRLSIDQFQTFSQLREDNEGRKKKKKSERQLKQNIKNGGGALQNAIYEELDEEQDLPRPGANIVLRKTTKEQMGNEKKDKEYC